MARSSLDPYSPSCRPPTALRAHELSCPHLSSSPGSALYFFPVLGSASFPWVSMGSLRVDGVGFGKVESLALDGERVGGGGDGMGLKAATALKNHSEAERRRRERINAHLDTLRSIVPGAQKLDKATLLAEVISHVKALKEHAIEMGQDLTIPSDVDELKVEAEGGGRNNDGSFIIKAFFCCKDQPELFEELKQTICALKLKIVRAEVCTLAGRAKNIITMLCEGNVDRHLLTASVHQALKSVLDRISPHPDLLPRFDFPNKKPRVSAFESCSSSS